MIDVSDNEISAFVGVSFSNKIIYNIIERDGEFRNTGISLINFLKTNKNLFVAKLIESQSYDSIKMLLDNDLVFGNFYDSNNSNMESFKEVYKLMNEKNSFNHYYIFDIIEDLLIIKTPEINEVSAIDYKNSVDVNNFINKLKRRL